MQFIEYGAPDLVTQAGSALALPPASSGLTWILVLAEQSRLVPYIWRNLTDRTLLSGAADAYSGFPNSDAAAVAASSLMVGYFVGRLRLIRLAPADWPAAVPATFAPPVTGMSPADLSQQVRTNGNFPSGTVPQTSIGN